jgi:hypothetical protein
LERQSDLLFARQPVLGAAQVIVDGFFMFCGPFFFSLG